MTCWGGPTGNSWLNRYSGTQAICRVMVEAPTDDMANRIAGALADLIRNQIGISRERGGLTPLS